MVKNPCGIFLLKIACVQTHKQHLQNIAKKKTDSRIAYKHDNFCSDSN